MDASVFDKLNSIYIPMHNKCVELCQYLRDKGCKVSSGFYNNHSIKINDDFATEYFPIPVISVESIGDIGIDIDNLWLEVVLSKENALKIDYNTLSDKYSFEIYGIENYLSDMYNKHINLLEIENNIKQSEETRVCIAFDLPFDVNVDEILAISQSLHLL